MADEFISELPNGGNIAIGDRFVAQRGSNVTTLQTGASNTAGLTISATPIRRSFLQVDGINRHRWRIQRQSITSFSNGLAVTSAGNNLVLANLERYTHLGFRYRRDGAFHYDKIPLPVTGAPWWFSATSSATGVRVDRTGAANLRTTLVESEDNPLSVRLYRIEGYYI